MEIGCNSISIASIFEQYYEISRIPDCWYLRLEKQMRAGDEGKVGHICIQHLVLEFQIIVILVALGNVVFRVNPRGQQVGAGSLFTTPAECN